MGPAVLGQHCESSEQAHQDSSRGRLPGLGPVSRVSPQLVKLCVIARELLLPQLSGGLRVPLSPHTNEPEEVTDDKRAGSRITPTWSKVQLCPHWLADPREALTSPNLLVSHVEREDEAAMIKREGMCTPRDSRCPGTSELLFGCRS